MHGGYWVEGDLQHLGDMVCIMVCTYNGFDTIEVVPETVGQYTGLKDKNGTRIFEGDIVKYRPEYWCEPMLSVVEYCADKWNYPAFDLKDHDYEANGLQCAHEEGCCEVVGNIYDNPELLSRG